MRRKADSTRNHKTTHRGSGINVYEPKWGVHMNPFLGVHMNRLRGYILGFLMYAL